MGDIETTIVDSKAVLARSKLAQRDTVKLQIAEQSAAMAHGTLALAIKEESSLQLLFA